MKVLFAVNSESISDAIIKKYQKDYREILSYKNVYYFNAIQKEIQKDKTYDRIVISADLEPFSNNNYESIDKFIFEKLDGISDEANGSTGNETSIILICSDRHTKASSFLVKLFGLGIYNALIGSDRSMEEVCRLINKPRTKKEAKIYYKIDTDDVNYRAENENEVDELQIQNILYHFKKLGKNTEKYANSFENIAAQYTEEQLKIIINCLPANVKRVLEGTSSKYQEIMAANGVMVQGVKSSNVEDQEAQKRTGLKIDIIENKLNQTKMTQPIVIPNSVKSTGSKNAKRVIAVPQKKENIATAEKVETQEKTKVPSVEAKSPVKKVAPEPKNNDEITHKKIESTNKNEKLVRLPNGKIVRKKIVPKQNNQENELVEKNENQPKTVKPVRKIANVPENDPVKVVQKSNETDQLEDLNDLVTEIPVNESLNTEQPKKRRGRPRKNPIELEDKPKGKRGRPRKIPIEEIDEQEDLEELPNLENEIDEKLSLDALNQEEMTPSLENEIDNDDFIDLLADDDELLIQEEPEEIVQDEDEKDEIEDITEEIELSELDELEDIDEFNEEDDSEFEEMTEEAFDEFDDYDEYGQYETSTQAGLSEENIDKLYEEDILSEENNDLEDINKVNQLSGFEDDEDDEFEEIGTEEELSEFEDNDFEDITEEIELPELDDLEDIDDLEEVDNTELEEIDDAEELAEFEDDEFDTLEDINDDFDMNLDGDNTDVNNEEDDDNLLLSDFEDVLSDDYLEEDENGLELDDNDTTLIQDDSLEDVFEENDNSVENFAQEDLSNSTEAIQSIESPIDYSMSNLNSLMTKDKKIVTFLGTTKNGVSFLVNNLAEIFASVGIDTAILDMTQNRNSYYIYTQNQEELRQIAYTSFEKLQNGVASGIKVKQNLTVYTALPNDGKDYPNVEEILSTLVQNHSLILIDCDFETNPAYFASCQEIYLVQSMDILTIQPLTAFLRDLKAQGVFEPEKVRVVINKELRVRRLTNKVIIEGMSSYNDPAMSFMTELFDKEVKYCSIPFEEMVYSKYLEGMMNCKVSISGYSKNFMNKLRILGDMVYPLTSRQSYSPNTKKNYQPNNFSSSMNSTLNKMKKNY